MMWDRIFLASSEKSLFEEFWEAVIDQYLTPKYGNYANITIDRDPTVTPAMIFFGFFIAIMIACAVTIFNRRTLGRPVRLLLKHDAIGRKNAKTMSELGLEKTGVLKYFINRLTLAKAIRCVEEDKFYGITEEENAPSEDSVPPSNGNPSAPSEDSVPPSNGDTPPICENDGVEEAQVRLSRREYKKKLKREKRAEANRLSDAKVGEISSRASNAYYVGQAAAKKYKRNIETDHFYIEDGMQYRARIRFSTKGANPVMLLFVAIGYVVIGVLIIKFLPDILGFVDRTISGIKR